MNMKNLFFGGLTMLAVVALTFASCSEEAETDKPYVGDWHTKAYYNADTVLEQMFITFTNTTFEDIVKQGLTADAMSEAVKVKGDVEYVEDGKINIILQAVSAGGSPYIDKENEEAFNLAFEATIGQAMKEEFEARYIITGDNTMGLIIPVKYMGMEFTDTLNLMK